MKNRESYLRPGYTTVSPYLMVDDVKKQMAFLQKVFLAETKEDIDENPDGHAEIKIGDTTIMMGKGRSSWPSRQSMNYVYVEHLDEVFQRAQEIGAKILLAPTERYYGDRECGFEDMHGNQWWCASFQQNLTREEKQKRFLTSKK